jgi:trehalose 6-phosphate phosphatase
VTPSRPLMENLDRIRGRLLAAPQVLLALDFDGTLAPIAATPEEASVPRKTARLLARIASLDGISIAVVSGRSIVDLKTKIEFPAVFVGNHGLEIESPAFSFTHPRADSFRPAIAQASWDLRQTFQCVRAVAVECKSLGVTVHYRGASEELRPWVRQAAEFTIQSYGGDLRCVPALQAVEIRPRLGWNKGSAVRRILRGSGVPAPLVICAGDDRTDEDLFDAVPRAVSIRVGERNRSKARYYAHDPAALCDFLELLFSGMLGRRGQTGAAGTKHRITNPFNQAGSPMTRRVRSEAVRTGRA